MVTSRIKMQESRVSIHTLGEPVRWTKPIFLSTVSLPYTFFLLNGDMELNKNRQIFVHKMFEKSQAQLKETYITAITAMNDTSPSLFFAQRPSIDDPYVC